MTLRAVFAGTPAFALPSLQAMCEAKIDIPAVYTQPDRPAGRGRKLRPGPIKQFAIKHGLSVRQPQSLAAEIGPLAQLAPDLIVVVAYGLILPQTVLDLPRLGCVNVHASLLPRWRGAAPIQRAIEAGDARTGITLMQMDQGLDTGALLAQTNTPIHPDDNTQTLHDRLSELGADLLIDLLGQMAGGPVSAQPQSAAGVCYAPRLSREEACLDWRESAATLDRRIRAFNPWPLARSHLDDVDWLIWRARPGPATTTATAGTVLEASAGLLRIQAGDGTLDLLELQLPGRRVLDARSFLNGHAVKPGARFTTPGKGHADS